MLEKITYEGKNALFSGIPSVRFERKKWNHFTIDCFQNRETGEYHQVMIFSDSASPTVIELITNILLTGNDENMFAYIEKINSVLAKDMSEKDVIGVFGEIYVMNEYYSSSFESWNPIGKNQIDIHDSGETIEVKTSASQDSVFKIKYRQHALSKPTKYAFVKLYENRETGIDLLQFAKEVIPSWHENKGEILLWIENMEYWKLKIDLDKTEVVIKKSEALNIPAKLERPIDDAIFDIKFTDLV